MSNFEDLTGKTFGNLTVLTRMVNDTKHDGARWLCRCNKCNKLIATRTDIINASTYETCNHGDELDIPNLGKVLKFVSSDFYMVQVDGREVVMHIDIILEHCKYEQN